MNGNVTQPISMREPERLSQATSERSNVLCTTRPGSHDALVDVLPTTDSDHDDQTNAIAMGARGAQTGVMSPSADEYNYRELNDCICRRM